MKSLIFLIILLIIISLVPSPTYKKVTSCTNDQCTSESSFELGPSLAKMAYDKLKGN